MIASTRSRSFLTGFLVALVAFVALNALVAHLRSDCGLPGLFKLARCYDTISRAGFPLQFYEEGGFGYHRDFDPWSLACDVVLGLTLSVGGGLLMLLARRARRSD